MADGTGVVSLDSDLDRKSWVAEGLIKNMSKSFWAAYQGSGFNNIVNQITDISKKAGHDVIFDFDGYLVGKAVKGKETATGTGEQKKKFSEKVTVERYRFVVDNGDKFDGVNIGDLNINEHQDSRSKLSDLWTRVKDQAIFDVLQQSATHRITLSTFTFDDFLDVENIIKTGIGYKVMSALTAAGKRMPLEPFMLQDGRPIWLMVIDSAIKNKLMKSNGAQQLFREADVRGNENRLIKGVIGKVGSFMLVEADSYFGSYVTASTDAGDFVDSDGYALLNRNKIQMAGLRQYTDEDGGFVPESWTGDGLTSAAKTFSRGLILGAGAMQVAIGKAPDYIFQKSQDFGINAESCLETWCGFKATKLTPENDDYAIAVGGISNGIIALDVQID